MTRRDDPTHLSTSVVAQLLGVKPSGIRAMIFAGSLPEPQWLTLGRRQERIYSLEWLALASDHLNVRRLDGLEIDNWIRPPNGLQLAVRIERPHWSARDVATSVLALSDLWDICMQSVEPSAEGEQLPELEVRRLSAGSPLDFLGWIHVGAGIVTAGGAASLFMYALKHPKDVTGAIPRLVAGWRDGWAEANEAKLRLIESRQNLARFESQAKRALDAVAGGEREVTIDGDGTRNLEVIAGTTPGLPSREVLSTSNTQAIAKIGPPRDDE